MMMPEGGSARWLRAGGFLLLSAGLGWLIADNLLRSYFPLQWNGPDIGGGALALLAVLAAVAGLVIVVLDIIDRRVDRGLPLPVTGWIGLAVSTLLAATYVEVLIIKPGDPSAGINGQVGVTVSASGSPVLVLEICRGSVQDVTVVGPNRGSTPNERLAQFHSDRPVTGTVLLDLEHPVDGWTEKPGAALSTVAPSTLKIAEGRGPKNLLRQVDFTDADLRALNSRTVHYSAYSRSGSDSARMPLTAFRAFACR